MEEAEKRPIEEIWKDLIDAAAYDTKRVRKLHKELVKGYGRKQGIPFSFRYPLFQYYLTAALLAVVIVMALIILVS